MQLSLVQAYNTAEFLFRGLQYAKEGVGRVTLVGLRAFSCYAQVEECRQHFLGKKGKKKENTEEETKIIEWRRPEETPRFLIEGKKGTISFTRKRNKKKAPLYLRMTKAVEKISFAIAGAAGLACGLAQAGAFSLARRTFTVLSHLFTGALCIGYLLALGRRVDKFLYSKRLQKQARVEGDLLKADVAQQGQRSSLLGIAAAVTGIAFSVLSLLGGPAGAIIGLVLVTTLLEFVEEGYISLRKGKLASDAEDLYNALYQHHVHQVRQSLRSMRLKIRSMFTCF